MKPPMLYLIGPPGAGKTTLLRWALSDVHRLLAKEPFLHTCYLRDGLCVGIQLGGARPGGFGGTDALSMSVIIKAIPWVTRKAEERMPLVGEGDRLATARFFEMAHLVYDLDVVWLNATWEEAQARRNARGSEQNEAWLRGRHSKVEKLGAAWATLTISASVPLEQAVATLQERPAIRAIREGIA